MEQSLHQQLKAAVIGLGFIGAGDQVSGDAIGQNVANLDGTHASALAGHPNIQLIGGSSRDDGRRGRFERRYPGVRTYADWREMLADERLDMVSIATNSPYHAEIAIACAEAGVRAVLCEKPIATKLADADRVIEACGRYGTILAVNHSRRWNPFWHAVRHELRSGTLGQVQNVFVHWSSGRIGNIGTHVFDLLRMLLDAEPVAVSASLDSNIVPDCRGSQFCDPGGWGTISFAQGIRAFIDAPQAAKAPLTVRIVGSLGQIIMCGGDRANLEFWPGGEHRTISLPATSESSLDRAIQDIVLCMSRGGKVLSSGEDGRAALEVVIGFHASDRLHGRWVELPISDADRGLEVMIG